MMRQSLMRCKVADTKKKSGGKKTNNSAKKAAQTRKKKAEMAKRHKKVVREVNLWIAVAVALFLFLSNFGVCGIVGNALKSVMLGSFGWMGYLFPIVLAVTVGIVAYNEMNRSIVSKIIAEVVLFVDLSLLFHLFQFGGSKASMLSFYREGAKGIFGGGIVGGALGKTLHSLLGLTGAYLIAAAILIICIVVLTEKSIMSVIRDKGQDAYENAREDSKARKEANAIEKQRKREEKDRRRAIEREQRRKRTVGVDFENSALGEKNTTEMKSVDDNSQNVHEIHIEGIDDFDTDTIEQDNTVYTYEEWTDIRKPVK